MISFNTGDVFTDFFPNSKKSVMITTKTNLEIKFALLLKIVDAQSKRGNSLREFLIVSLSISMLNSFSLDIVGSKGSINMRNLCKWGPSELSVGQRVFPSGIPIMNKKILKINDPTWRLEHNFFFNKKYNPKYFFKRDKWISKQVKNLG